MSTLWKDLREVVGALPAWAVMQITDPYGVAAKAHQRHEQMVHLTEAIGLNEDEGKRAIELAHEDAVYVPHDAMRALELRLSTFARTGDFFSGGGETES